MTWAEYLPTRMGGESSDVIPGVFSGLCFEIIREVLWRAFPDSAGFERVWDPHPSFASQKLTSSFQGEASPSRAGEVGA
jgi:hypothetical protein